MNGPTATGFRAILVALAVLSMAPPVLRAQDAPKRPTLGGHVFVPNTMTRSPFPRTQLRQSLGVGQILDFEVTRDFVIRDDTIRGLKGDLLFAALELEYEYAIKEWLAVWVEVALNARLGTDVGAILAEGATVLTAFELGWLVRLVQTEEIALSATAEVWNNGYTGINVYDWVAGIIEDQRVPLVRKTPSLRGGAGLRFAWGVNPWLGLNADGQVGYGEALVRIEEDKWFLRGGVAASVDLNPVTPVPIGLVLGLSSNSFPERGADIADRVTRVLWRVAYTGRDDFVVALDNTWARVDRTTDENVDAGLIQFEMQYYF